MPSTDNPPLLLVSDPGWFWQMHLVPRHASGPALVPQSGGERVIRRATAEWVEAVKSAGSFGAWAWDVAQAH